MGSKIHRAISAATTLSMLLCSACSPNRDTQQWIAAREYTAEQHCDTSSETIRYQASGGDVAQALARSRQQRELDGHYDHELLQQLALMILERGCHSRSAQEQILALYGASLSMHEEAYSLLERGLRAYDPTVQLAAVNLLARSGLEGADTALEQAMGSQYLLIRLNAAHALASRQHPHAIQQIESLMAKAPTEVLPLFPELLAAHGGPRATLLLQRLMVHQNEAVRCAAVAAAAGAHRDDLLPTIRQNSHCFSPAEQEVCCLALTLLNDTSALSRYRQMCASAHPAVKAAAYRACYLLGDKEAADQLKQEAANGNLHAIVALEEVPSARDFLANITLNSKPPEQLHAAIALLHLGDSRCLPVIADLLTLDSTYLFLPQQAVGGSRNLWTVVDKGSYPSLPSFAAALSLDNRENLLGQIAKLDSEHFLGIADALLERPQLDLVPATCRLLEVLGSEQAYALLESHREHVGVPLIRSYCNLSLYRAGLNGNYADKLREDISTVWATELIRFRPFAPHSPTDAYSHQLSPSEKSQLLVESVEALAQSQDTESLDLLVDTLLQGNPLNRYALAGILLRATL